MARILRGEIRWAGSWVKISQIRTLSAERIGTRIDRVQPEQVDLLVEGLNEVLAG